MRLLHTIRCWAGRHPPGHFCAYCGKLLDPRPLRAFKVESLRPPRLEKVVMALDEEHAAAIAGRGWHRANLSIERVDSRGAPQEIGAPIP